MSSPPSATSNLINPSDPHASLNAINIAKLSPTNYLTRSVQIKALVRGHDLIKFIDPATAPPSSTTIITGVETTLQAWETLASTYGKPTRRHIKQLKQHLQLCVKGTKDIDGYMQLIKTKSDALALLGSPVDREDLTDIILAGLCDDYKPVIKSVHSRDSPISFAELHEKLLNREISLANTQSQSSSFPVTVYYAQNSASHAQTNQTRRPYLGKCQACGTQGHNAKFCPTFRLSPRAYNASTTPPDPSAWLIDSGATHYITSDLANLSMHLPYTGSERGERSQLGGADVQIPDDIVEEILYRIPARYLRWRYNTAGPMPRSFTLISPERNLVSVNGSVFWLLACDNDHSEILVMDLHTEAFRTVSLPKDVSSGYVYMWSLKGRLYVSNLRQGFDSDVWSFVQDELDERWERTKFASGQTDTDTDSKMTDIPNTDTNNPKI
ncbi:Zinc finger CCHC-type [Arabidopsis thaliana x Arabidopsis arenosa]|uniref:Zinc finger CCHC-type n=1 Tax=Arabidopsis thaliana x Arabidopsis arenosa TaxID=1240361 RepID=A0A8T2C6A5_9BRAS|nr:Zinc finger CCHC-type [Arabidopsis thaliana x Arabidopsis arenosa]